MKVRSHHSTSSAPWSKRRGRPPKSEQECILEKGSGPVVLEFRSRPLRCPVDVQFEPYYKRLLNGDLSVISEYVDRNAARRDLDPSFYELLGRLAHIRFYAAADLVLSNMERRGNIGVPTQKEADIYWHKRLLPLADAAKKWIRRYVKKSDLSGWDRTRAWIEYAEQTGRGDLQRAKEIAQRGLHETLWRRNYIELGLVPKEIFWLLAERRGTATRPSWAVRTYLDADIKTRLENVHKKIY